MNSGTARRYNELLDEAVQGLEKSFNGVREMDLYNEFLEKKLVELTHMTPREIQESWKIYHEAHPLKQQEAVAQ